MPYFHVVFSLPGRDRRYRLPEQGRHLRSAVQSVIGDDAGRSPPIPSTSAHASVSSPCSIPGVGAHPPSPRPHDRAGRRILSRRQPLGRVPPELFPLGTRAVAVVPTIAPEEARRRSCRRRAAVLRQSCRNSAHAKAFAAYLAPLRNSEWVVYSKRPFGGPEAILAYLSRYTHRVAISNRRLIALDENGVTFNCKDYRLAGPERYRP